MRIYLDVLVITNAALSLGLCACAGVISGSRLHPAKSCVCSLVLGTLGMLSFYSLFWGGIVKLCCLPFAAWACYGRGRYFVNLACLALVHILFAGAICVWQLLFAPTDFIFTGGSVYFQIGFWPLVTLCAATYGAVQGISFLCTRFSGSFIVVIDGVRLQASVDTGNTLRSPYTGQVCILCNRKAPPLTDAQRNCLDRGKLPRGFVYIPVTTAAGVSLLPACDKTADIYTQKGRQVAANMPLCLVFCRDPIKGADILLHASFQKGGTV